MAVDVSRIPNNNKFDPVREAILQLQTEIEDTGAAIGNGTLTIGTSSPLSGDATFTANQIGNTTITIGIDDSDYLSLSDTGTQTLSGSLSLVNITLSGYLRGPSTFVIDPATHGDDTGTLVIAGNLQVDGTTTTINSTTLTVDDKNIVIASGAANASAADGAGITIDGASATMTYNSTSDRFVFNKDIETDLVGNVTGNADTATTWETARTITIGDTGKSVDGSADVTWTRTEIGITKTNIDALNINADQVDGKHAADFTLDYVTTNAATTDNKITLGGGLHVNTLTNTKPLEISRIGGTITQVVKIGVTDTTADFKYVEDTSTEGNGAFGSYRFILGGNDGETDIVALQIYKDSLNLVGSLDVGGSTIIDASRNVFIPDDSNINVGTGNDLEIYHNGLHSFIDNSTNALYIRNVGTDAGDDIIFIANDTNSSVRSYIRINTTDGAVQISHHDGLRLATTATGISVTGEIEATGDVTANAYYGDGSNLTGVLTSLNFSGIDGITLTDTNSTIDSYFHANVDYDAGLYTITSNARYGADYIQIDGRDDRTVRTFAISPKDIGEETNPPRLYLGGDVSATAPNTLTDWDKIYFNATEVIWNGHYVATQTWVTNTVTNVIDLQDVTDNGATTTDTITVGGLNTTAGEVETPRRKRIYLNLGNVSDAWYKIANVNQGNSGITIRGALNNHVESFGTQRIDLTIFGREGESNSQIEVTGRFEVAKENVGIRIVAGATTPNGVYTTYDVYVKATKYTQAELDVYIEGNTENVTWFGTNSSTTTQPTGTVEFDNTATTQGSYVVEASQIKEVATEDWATSEFVNVTGDTMTGSLTIDGGSGGSTAKINLDSQLNGQSSVDFITSGRHYRLVAQPASGSSRLDVYDQTGAQYMLSLDGVNSRIGLFNSTPQARLDITTSGGTGGGIRLSSNETEFKDLEWRDTTSGEMWIWSHRVHSQGNRFEAWYNNGTDWNSVPAISIGTGNTVGINKLASSHALDVAGSVAATQGIFSASAPLNFTATGTGTYNLGVMYNNTNGMTFEAPLETDSSSAARRPFTLTWRGGYTTKGGLQLTGDTKIYTDNTGLGIDTTSPSHKLHVNGDIRQSKIVIRDDSIERYDNPVDDGGLNFNYYGYLTTFDYFRDVNIWNGKGGFIAKFDGSSGNVGIGTTSPQDLLNIHNSSASANIGLKITRGTQTHGLRLGVNNSHAFLWTTEAQDLAFATSNQQRLTIQSGGNVGIGTTSPSAKLNIAGNLGAVIGGGNSAIKMTNTDSGNYCSISAGIVGSYNDGMDFSVDGSRKMVIRSATGNVGIGTDSPSQKLDVNGYARATSGFVGSNGLSLFGDNSSTERVFVTTGGSVGIGTTSPTSGYKLDVTGSILSQVGSGNTSVVVATSNANGALNALQNVGLELATDSTNKRISFRNGNSTNMVILDGGSVGINTTSPSFKLDVNGTVRASSYLVTPLIYSGGGNVVFGNVAQFNDWVGIGHSPSYNLDVNGNARITSTLTVGSNITSSGIIEDYAKKRFRLDLSNDVDRWWKIATVNKGNSGISIKGALNNHVESFGTQRIDLTIYGREANNGANIEVVGNFDVATEGVGVRIVKLNDGTYDHYDVYIKSTKYTQCDLAVTIEGSVGYVDWHGSTSNTTTQPTGLGVEFDNTSYGEGNYQVSDSAVVSKVNSSSLIVVGDIIAYGSTSDISFKENIKPIEGALDKVKKLQGVTFDWKEGSTDILKIKEDYGFIAQEVQQVLPELVRENENGKLSLRDKGIISVLVEAIKEQQKQIDELKARLDGSTY